jgi:acyl-CoA thioesterase YciA
MAEDARRAIPTYAPVIRTIAMPADTNPEGDIFGGWLMSQMDLAGATLAFDLAKGRCATVAVSEIVFLNPVSVGDEVSLFAEVINVGRTSIRVAVEAWRRRRDASQASQVTKGVFVYVAIDNDRKPRPVMGAPDSL